MVNYRLLLCILLSGVFFMIKIDRIYSQETRKITSEERYESYLKFYTLFRGTTVRPHWYPDGNRFWYTMGTADSTVFYTVNPEANDQTKLFDNRRLHQALQQVLGHKLASKGIPFTDFDFVSRTDVIQFQVEGKVFL